MSGFELRAHHALCVRFFRGKGYSEAFVKNMSAVVGALRAESPPVTLRRAADAVCRGCPHNTSGVCDSAEKVARYDDAVLRLAGLADGDALPWSALSALIDARILGPGRLAEVCGDCQWYSICAQATVE